MQVDWIEMIFTMLDESLAHKECNSGIRPQENYDFQTKFSVALSTNTNHSRDGFAFFLSDPGLPFSKDIEEGGGLGLVDGDQTLNSAKHHSVALEFDSYRDSWDPNSRHVGVNLKSKNSSITRPLLSEETLMDLLIAVQLLID